MRHINAGRIMSDQDMDALREAEMAYGEPEKARLSSVGEQLAAERQARGWSVDQVSHYLKLAPRQIEAIETDNLAALPAAAVTRGFIRSYAKLLGLDSAPLLDKLNIHAPPVNDPLLTRRPLAASFSESRNGIRKTASFRLSWWLIALAAVVVIAGLIFSNKQFLQSLPKQFPQESQRRMQSPRVETASLKVEQPPVAPQVVANEVVANKVAAVPAVATAPTAESQGETPAGGLVAVAVVANADSQTDVAAIATNVLELVMNKDSWLEVRRVENKQVLASRLVKAGTVETFDIDSPVTLKIGNASAVDATFRGAPLDLRAVSKSNVARLTLK
jgi:cytoskeleton protein RodZ